MANMTGGHLQPQPIPRVPEQGGYSRFKQESRLCYSDETDSRSIIQSMCQDKDPTQVGLWQQERTEVRR